MTPCQGQHRKIVYKFEYFDEFVTAFEMVFGNETGDRAGPFGEKKVVKNLMTPSSQFLC
jgi:hypothetical protein